MELTSTIESVDSEIASEWLGHNRHNRGVKRRQVSRYARDMQAGRWQFTGDAIKFAEDGVLLDGQHRLLAIVEADTTQPMLIVRGLPRTTQDVMDTGVKRSAGDALGLHGEKNPALLASVAGMVLTDGGRVRRNSSTAELMSVIEAEPSLRVIVGDVCPALKITVASPSVIAYAYWRLDKIDSSDAAKFFDALASLADLPAGSPILALHRRLGAHVRKPSSEGYRKEALAYIFSAWNAWRRKEDRAIVKLAYSNGRIAIPEPV